MSVLPSPINVAVERGIAALLKIDPDTKQRLAPLDGKVIAVNLSKPEISLVLSIVNQQIHVIGQLDTPADVTFSTSLATLRTLIGRNSAIDRRDVKIEGDMHLGKQLREVIAGVDPDWEEALSPFLGDTLVHQLSVLGQGLSKWFERSRSSLMQDTSEYLQEESELLAPNSEVRQFCLDVDEVRASVDRLNARLNRLEERKGQSSGEKTC